MFNHNKITPRRFHAKLSRGASAPGFANRFLTRTKISKVRFARLSVVQRYFCSAILNNRTAHCLRIVTELEKLLRGTVQFSDLDLQVCIPDKGSPAIHVIAHILKTAPSLALFVGEGWGEGLPLYPLCGISTINVAPMPGSLCTQIDPPCASTASLQNVRPRPRPARPR